MLSAQNYEQQGDELFAQAQYDKAAKKYSAAIELLGASSSLQAKKEKCAKCAPLLARAKSAEESASTIEGYEKASKLYSDLFAIHALPAYKSKANAMKQKANAIRNQQRAAEQAERERQAKLDAERKAKAEAERNAKLEKERRAKEREAEKIRQAKEKEEQAKLRAEQEKKKRLDEDKVLAFSTLKKILETPLGLQNVKWTDSKNVQKKALLNKYPQLSISNRYTLDGQVSGHTYYYNELSAAIIDLNHEKGKEVVVTYKFQTQIRAVNYMDATAIREDLKNLGFDMSPFIKAVSILESPCVFNKITFTKMKVDYSGTKIIISFTIERPSTQKR